MKTYRIYQRCALLLASVVFMLASLADCSLAEDWTVTNGVQENNRNISFTIDMDVIPGYKDTSRFLVGLHNRSDAFHPRSVLISGILLAPAGTEIRNAGLEMGGQWFPADEVCRFYSQNIPESELNDMEVEVDKDRSAFAFLVNIDGAELQDGYIIRMEVSGVVLTFGDYRITLNSAFCPYEDAEHALEGYIAKYGERNEGVRMLQQNLASKGYLSENQINGSYDETTVLALKEFCKTNGFSESETEECGRGATQAVYMRTANPQSLSKKEWKQIILDTLHKEMFTLDISLDGSQNAFTVELWMIIAAGALLASVILVLILILTRKKKPADDLNGDDPIITANDYGPDMVDIDEPTIDLDKENTERTIEKVRTVNNQDENTVELKEFLVMLRMFYNGMYADRSVVLRPGETAVIGRSSEANIQTNPEDKSVSSRHGLFTVQNETVVYTDQSTNGTRVGESLYLGKNRDVKTYNLPLNARVTMEIGAHKVWIIVRQQH